MSQNRAGRHCFIQDKHILLQKLITKYKQHGSKIGITSSRQAFMRWLRMTWSNGCTHQRNQWGQTGLI